MTEPTHRTDAWRTSDVRHMKWWGWGVEGVGFRHEDKPGFAPFVEGRRPRLDGPAGRPDLSELNVPGRGSAEEFVALADRAVGGENALRRHVRVVHTYGKSLRDLVRLRAGDSRGSPTWSSTRPTRRRCSGSSTRRSRPTP